MGRLNLALKNKSPPERAISFNRSYKCQSSFILNVFRNPVWKFPFLKSSFFISF